MNCARCGATVPPNGAFCPACGAPVSPTTLVLKRPSIVTLLAVLNFLGAGAGLLFAVVVFAFARDASDAFVIGFLIATLALLQLRCGLGLWDLKPYGRTLQLVLAWIGLLGFPVGTLVSILILVYLRKPGVKALFSGKPAAELTPEELAQVAAVSQWSGAMTALVIVVSVVCVIVVMSVLAALAIPNLLSARMDANATSAVSVLTSIASAEEAYAARVATAATR